MSVQNFKKEIILDILISGLKLFPIAMDKGKNKTQSFLYNHLISETDKNMRTLLSTEPPSIKTISAEEKPEEDNDKTYEDKILYVVKRCPIEEALYYLSCIQDEIRINTPLYIIIETIKSEIVEMAILKIAYEDQDEEIMMVFNMPASSNQFNLNIYFQLLKTDIIQLKRKTAKLGRQIANVFPAGEQMVRSFLDFSIQANKSIVIYMKIFIYYYLNKSRCRTQIPIDFSASSIATIICESIGNPEHTFISSALKYIRNIRYHLAEQELIDYGWADSQFKGTIFEQVYEQVKQEIANERFVISVIERQQAEPSLSFKPTPGMQTSMFDQ